MLILLPPSEGKNAPRRGARLDPASWPDDLSAPRRQVLDSLVEVCRTDPEDAVRALKLSAGLAGEVQRNAEVYDAPTARADHVYAGVLYDALDLASLDEAARRRATRWLAVTSSVFGLLRPAERIPAYRLSGDVTLPGLGSVAGHWRTHLGPVVERMVGDGLLVDMRSGTYQAFWRPGPELAPRTATVRVLHEAGGKRSVVSHFNKATKGRIVRAMLVDGTAPRTPAALAEHLTRLGWRVEVAPEKSGTRLDVVVTEV
ncbi:UPF0246 protein [Marmoricola endophyticus]|uniref:UPF0246 protein n=1 Tax=Marmoricola endophyticus TaxID=2040280 RepID=A0A917BBN9_9ACTN|nr:peroxide stress protein YaaA [Marmoricola endophyticus]GGF30643.1 UPF0246 protein [Marmoricola endophyticus]